MIAENLQDLISKVVSVPAFTASASLVLGGKGTDPGMLKVPLPAAWIMYSKDDADEPPFGHSSSGHGMVPATQVLLMTCSILIYLEYTTQSDMLSVQLPLLESIALAIKGTEAPSGHRWRYLGQKLAVVYPDRIAYEQHYTLTAAL